MDDTLTMLIINYQWRRIISDALQSYADSILSTLDDSLIDDFRNQFQALLNDFYTADNMDATPVGAIVWFPSTLIPAKWLICDGTTYAQADYPELYDILENFQSGTDFNVPDLVNRFVYGVQDEGDIGTTGGQNNGTINSDNLPAHTHTVPANTHTILAATGVGVLTNRVVQGNNTGVINSTAINASAATVTGSTGTGDPFENRPAFMNGHFIIKALP